ncbi:uncharacterized protein TRAVEDRAFT_46924 [Trametes versicolor FP-101664 SS1]|uniref:uncharacterized protein n=1 Tax=Trametes versicolor (strain FP-101664) TaxID=717944 RepID=UPI0004621226|nr:uncharacterized protein TRAVEDRAFT_46924 [Trametes versicolor FP-101664 SS1]EIW59619.1 hypothetical protein TRAVEDRAFT_46924 [Trametes versicolor FP-101664 SS1]
MSFYTQSTAYVYTFDSATGALSSELMRVPGGRCDKMDTGRVLRTVGKDTEGLVDEVLLPRGEFVYFVERKAAQGAVVSESEKENEGAATGRSRAVRKAMREVREVELMARKLEAEMMAMDEEPECAMMGKRGVVEVDSADEDESDDESVWSDDDEEESLWGGDDDESMMENDEEEIEAEVDSDEEDEMALRAAEAFAMKDEEDWEVALFGGYEDEAAPMDTDETKVEDENRTPPVVDVPTTAEQWTCEDDWEIVDLPLAHMDLVPSGYNAGATLTRTRMEADPRTMTKTRAEADVDRRADTRTSADTRTRADLRISADPGNSADLRSSADAERTKVKTRPMVPMRTLRTDGTPRMAAATRTKTKNEPAPRITSVQVSRIKAIAGDVLSAFRGKKRKADRDEDDSNEDATGTPSDGPGALAVTKTLAGLKFKNMRTCLSNLGPTGTISGRVPTASAGFHTKVYDRKLSPQTIDPDLAGRKRKNEDKEEGELSEDDTPLAKRARTTQAPRTSNDGAPKPERGARGRWNDRRQWAQRKISTTMGQRRSQMAQLGR